MPDITTIRAVSLLVTVCLIGCPGGDEVEASSTTGSSDEGGGSTSGAETGVATTTPEGSSGRGDTSTGAGLGDVSGDGTQEESGDEPATSEITAGVDPCDACDPVAICENEICLCPDGYSGDGTVCADVDECVELTAGCDPNATCTNNEGAFSCECNDGWGGDGLACVLDTTCEDAPCGLEATCSDQADGFTCECNPDFEGDGITCLGTLPYGGFCDEDTNACETGLCLLGTNSHCTDFCDQGIANNCADLGLAGFCVPVGGDEFVCAGDLDTGFDPDDSILSPGDSAMRTLAPLGDADMFHLALPAGNFPIVVTPNSSTDVQLEIYGQDASPLAILNAGADGTVEGGVLNVVEGGVFFAVVREVGVSTGTYSISVTLE
ncbi:MAG: hypothetical protein KUG77_04565 [Nannocystaceae bacterium]|nr:hypothetical protein [Nannocystaceae bacterium]